MQNVCKNYDSVFHFALNVNIKEQFKKNCFPFSSDKHHTHT